MPANILSALRLFYRQIIWFDFNKQYNQIVWDVGPIAKKKIAGICGRKQNYYETSRFFFLLLFQLLKYFPFIIVIFLAAYTVK